MSRRRLLVLLAGVLPLVSKRAFAHNYVRVIGRITKRQESMIAVEDKDQETTEIWLDNKSEVWRDGKRVEVSELKVGVTVVADAFNDDPRGEDPLLALSIKIVPPIK
jgi:hypothetical protein